MSRMLLLLGVVEASNIFAVQLLRRRGFKPRRRCSWKWRWASTAEIKQSRGADSFLF